MNLIDHRDIEIQIVVYYNLVCWFLKGQEWGPDSGPDWGAEWDPEGGVHVLSTPVAKPRAKFLTMQKLDKQLLFKLVRAMEMILNAVINNKRVQ